MKDEGMIKCLLKDQEQLRDLPGSRVLLRGDRIIVRFRTKKGFHLHGDVRRSRHPQPAVRNVHSTSARAKISTFCRTKPQYARPKINLKSVHPCKDPEHRFYAVMLIFGRE